MKFIYVAGLDHSGTTLSEHLLNSLPQSVCLGEVASFFSWGHMKSLRDEWGGSMHAYGCSCGKNWKTCEFWSGLLEFNGLISDLPLPQKYRELFSHVRAKYGEQATIIDTSKSTDVLRTLIEHHHDIGFDLADLLIIMTIKDVRGFAMSMKRKGTNHSLLSTFRTFNLWLTANKQQICFLKDNHLPFLINYYEQLCRQPEKLVQSVTEIWGEEADTDLRNTPGVSHIAMGNTRFIKSHRDKITYDSRWAQDRAINLVYSFHRKARKFNSNLSLNAGLEQLTRP